MEEPFFFEPDGFRLFAITHRPDRVRAPVAVVVCHPYAEEKQLSVPVLVRCARLLATDGFPVLRFDLRGHGDSAGDTADASVTSGVAETLAAARTARERFGVPRVVLLGLRFGASLAVRAAERDSAVAGLVLWSPIVTGAQYVDEMIRKRLFADMLGKRRTSRAQALEELAREGRLEVEGNFLGRQMSEEMTAMDLPAEVGTLRSPVLVTGMEESGPARTGYERLVQAYQAAGAAATLERAGTKPFWERSALYEHYVPEDLLEVTRRWMRARWPAT